MNIFGHPTDYRYPEGAGNLPDPWTKGQRTFECKMLHETGLYTLTINASTAYCVISHFKVDTEHNCIHSGFGIKLMIEGDKSWTPEQKLQWARSLFKRAMLDPNTFVTGLTL